MQSITLRRPDDWHTHLRDADALARTVTDTARCFARAIAMPNLTTPITSVTAATNYRERILQHAPKDNSFTPLMTLYLTEQLTADEIIKAAKTDFIKACKLYPAGATTGSSAGVQDIKKLYPIFDAMQQAGLLLLIHGESIEPEADIFDREKLFIEQQLQPLIKKFPKLRVVLEHITTKTAVEFITAAPQQVAATITAHHLLYNRNALLGAKLHPHYYCMPILKRETDRQALITAATSGNAKFFLGTDSAPHTQSNKESSCGCAGIYSAHAAIELYAEVFETANALDKLEGFASQFGANFYDLPLNETTLTLIKQPWEVPNTLSFGEQKLVPLRAGKQVQWRIKDD
ncbi:MAG: dihydroorotase [Gammaproteobacteria bacterium]|nr:dihydroorotase [Gammaproteobacteria bacterium]MCH9744609.1 dihydroorotase [Gammaproteobacteria bacterium]